MAIPSADVLISGIQQGDRSLLARAITLAESTLPAHRELMQNVLERLPPQPEPSLRLGITGPPGVGKSTFIEAFGLKLCEEGKKVAVLAIDPSSVHSGGSLLGDKTRMFGLSMHPNAFIRPSPSGGHLGGLAKRTREAVLLCEAAGYDHIILETVGVGQSEVTVRFLVDCFILLAQPGAGDELQAVKKGIMELADIIVVTKADGPNADLARQKLNELKSVLRHIPPMHRSRAWRTDVVSCSSTEGHGMDDVLAMLKKFVQQEGNALFTHRRTQEVAWLRSILEEKLIELFFNDSKVRENLEIWNERILKGETNALHAGEAFWKEFQPKMPQ